MFKQLQGENLNITVVVISAGLWFAALTKHVHVTDHHTWQWLLSICLGLSFFAAVFNYWRLLKITEAPISTIASAAQGYIELQGVASTSKSLKTPFQAIPCVWFRSWVYADIPPQSESERGDNRLLEYVESNQIFELKDRSGACLVNPKGAEVIYSEMKTHRKNNHRYVEEYLPAGKKLYVIGHLNTLHEHVGDEVIRKQMGDLLSTWKSHPKHLLLRFDKNGDGRIDMDEWEQARAEARKEVELRHQMRENTDIYTLSKPKSGQLFLISALSPDALRKKYQHWSLFHLVMLLIFLMAYQKLA